VGLNTSFSHPIKFSTNLAMSCQNHNWSVLPSDRRRNESFVYKHVHQEVCSTCSYQRWVCEVEGCKFQPTLFPPGRATTSSNIGTHLIKFYGILTEPEALSSEQKKQKKLTAFSSFVSSPLTDSVSSTTATIGETSSETKAKMLRYLVQSRTAFNQVDQQSWKAMF
jgi:hypothetical protein